jgi:xanthine dehydrogenase iron-sulfur cluster and FAD-binding subunit A
MADGDAIQLRVNGKTWSTSVPPDTPLLYVLTNDLALQGPRFGCGLEQCGCCSVLADGVEIRSCITPTSRVIGKSLTTLEGLPGRAAVQEPASDRSADSHGDERTPVSLRHLPAHPLGDSARLESDVGVDPWLRNVTNGWWHVATS